MHIFCRCEWIVVISGFVNGTKIGDLIEKIVGLCFIDGEGVMDVWIVVPLLFIVCKVSEYTFFAYINVVL